MNVPHPVLSPLSPCSTAAPPSACPSGSIEQLACHSNPVIPLLLLRPLLDVRYLRSALSMLCSLSLFPLLSITTFPSACSALDVHRALSHVSSCLPFLITPLPSLVLSPPFGLSWWPSSLHALRSLFCKQYPTLTLIPPTHSA